ncbi:MAG: uncharacterized protein KVP18_000128 [Porospora cf. gigantea A]|uniref:uncharacterized protein n=3 Tax=Porospora cf. gigantea A TaxID=2853593 RepID=UPI0035594FB3|nr:MAG: hypothetical protein KVP18_000128 [Porospora cf. gigantea A]
MRGLQLISKTHSPLGHAPPLLGGRTWKFLRTRRNRGAPPSSSSSFGWSTESDVPAPPEEEDAKGPTRARLRMRKNTLRDYWDADPVRTSWERRFEECQLETYETMMRKVVAEVREVSFQPRLMPDSEPLEVIDMTYSHAWNTGVSGTLVLQLRRNCHPSPSHVRLLRIDGTDPRRFLTTYREGVSGEFKTADIVMNIVEVNAALWNVNRGQLLFMSQAPMCPDCEGCSTGLLDRQMQPKKAPGLSRALRKGHCPSEHSSDAKPQPGKRTVKDKLLGRKKPPPAEPTIKWAFHGLPTQSMAALAVLLTEAIHQGVLYEGRVNVMRDKRSKNAWKDQFRHRRMSQLAMIHNVSMSLEAPKKNFWSSTSSAAHTNRSFLVGVPEDSS